jgi:hypothetical protein
VADAAVAGAKLIWYNQPVILAMLKDGSRPMRTNTSHPRKLEELILYLCERSEADVAFGVTKLGRLLVYLDFAAYTRFGDSISGGQYRQERHGPTLVGLADVLDELSRQGFLAVREADDADVGERRVSALRSADLDVFTPREVDLVSRVIDRCRGLSACETAERVREFPALELAAEGELIPYETALVGKRLPTDDEVRRGQDLTDIAAGCAGVASHGARSSVNRVSTRSWRRWVSAFIVRTR